MTKLKIEYIAKGDLRDDEVEKIVGRSADASGMELKTRIRDMEWDINFTKVAEILVKLSEISWIKIVSPKGVLI